MASDIALVSGRIEWGVTARAFGGQLILGDHYLVEPFSAGVLLAVVDGLGHGEGAATAAHAAVAAVKDCAQEPLEVLFERCHQALRRSRGAVMSMAAFNAAASTLTWAGVGNVNGCLLRAAGQAGSAREHLLPRGGVLGYQLPTPRPVTLSLAHGDTLILATDGISSSFSQQLVPGEPPQSMAEHIMAHSRRGADDALVLVARYLGV